MSSISAMTRTSLQIVYIYLVSGTCKYKFEMALGMEWLSEWLLFNANSAIFQLYHGDNKLYSMRWWWWFVLNQHLNWILDFYNASSRSRVEMLYHLDTLSWYRVNQSFVLFLKAAYIEEKQYIPIVLSLDWVDRD